MVVLLRHTPGGARTGGFVKPTSILSGRPRFAHLGTSVGAAGGVISRNCAWDSREWPKWSAPHPYRTGGPPGRIPKAVVEVRSHKEADVDASAGAVQRAWRKRRQSVDLGAAEGLSEAQI